MSDFVLDASAVLALINSEPGADTVADAIASATISAVNFAEVVSRLAHSGMPGNAIRGAMQLLSLDVMSFDEQQAHDAGLLRPSTRRHGLSLGDRCCLGLARKLGLPAIKADRAWADLGLDIDIRLIR